MNGKRWFDSIAIIHCKSIIIFLHTYHQGCTGRYPYKHLDYWSTTCFPIIVKIFLQIANSPNVIDKTMKQDCQPRKIIFIIIYYDSSIQYIGGLSPHRVDDYSDSWQIVSMLHGSLKDGELTRIRYSADSSIRF